MAEEARWWGREPAHHGGNTATHMPLHAAWCDLNRYERYMSGKKIPLFNTNDTNEKPSLYITISNGRQDSTRAEGTSHRDNDNDVRCAPIILRTKAVTIDSCLRRHRNR